MSIERAEELIRVIELSGVKPLVRLSSNNAVQIKRVMDSGAHGVIVPMVKTEKEVNRYANDTEFGLAAYFYARDVNRIWKVSEGLESGIVGINTGLISTEVAPFGGFKESGIGREGSHYGLDDYLEIKYLCYGGIS